MYHRKVGRVFLLSLFEHFVATGGGIITPVYKYFRADGQLTQLGCLTVHECMHIVRSGSKNLLVLGEKIFGLKAWSVKENRVTKSAFNYFTYVLFAMFYIA